MIKAIEKVVKEFIEDWKKHLYEWNNEIDVQAELVGRIKYNSGGTRRSPISFLTLITNGITNGVTKL